MNVKMQMIEDAAVIYPDKSLTDLAALARMRNVTPMKVQDKAALHLLMNSGNIHLGPCFVSHHFGVPEHYLHSIKANYELAQNAQPA